MNKIRLFLVFIFCIHFFCGWSQTWQWARRAGGEPKSSIGSDEIMGIVTDRAGNSYSLLTLDGANRVVSIDGNIPLNDSDITTQGGGSQNEDAVLVSYDKCGKLRWLKTITSDIGLKAISIGIDSNANIYTLVNLRASFDVAIGKDTIFPNTKERFFMITKFDSSGKYKWLKLPTPDTVSSYYWNGAYMPISMQTDPNGDCHIFCYFGKGLVSGSTNLVSTKIGYHVLQYNSSGKPVALTPLDIKDSATVIFNPKWTRFFRTNSGKYVLSTALIPYNNTQGTLYFGNQRVTVSSAMGMFSSTGQLLWKVNNEALDSNKGTICYAYWDEKTKSIFISGCMSIRETFLGYTASTAPATTNPYFQLSMTACIDTLGQKKWINVSSLPANSFNSTGNSLNSGIILKNSKLISGGSTVGQVDWGGQKFNDGIAQGYMAAFDANTGNFLQLDSVKDVGGTSSLEVFTSDTNNNVYAGAVYQNTLKVGSQSIYSVGGFYDLCIAKWGFAEASCLLVPLEFLGYNNYVYYPLSTENKPQQSTPCVAHKWATGNETNVNCFNVQYSLNASDFKSIINIKAKNKSINDYLVNDTISLSINNFLENFIYYRIESVDVDGKKQYSNISKIAIKKVLNETSIFPNPATSSIRVYNVKGIKEIKVYNLLGQQVLDFKPLENNPSEQMVMLNTLRLSNGLYIVKTVNFSDEVFSNKVVIR